MTELEKIAYAKSFIDRLANGINPLDNQPVREEDVVNNVRLSRCFFFVSDILRQVIENGGTTRQKRPKKVPFALAPEELSRLSPSENPIPISEFVKRINDSIDLEKMKKLPARLLTRWLIGIGMLRVENDADGKSRRVPTEEGRQIGIFSETRRGMYGEYTVVLYNRAAQEFLLDNLPAIVAFGNATEERKEG